MLIDESYNTLFHRSVTRDQQPLTMRDVYNSPSVYPLYNNTSFENPLWGYTNLRNSITFGTYQDTPIEWQILGFQQSYGDRGLILISKDILFQRNFDSSSNVWRDSSLRSYLNDSFYNSSFSDEERPFIMESITDTTDMVFLLSKESNDSYNYQLYYSMSSRDKRKAKYNGSYDHWWLRSPDIRIHTDVAIVYNEGTVTYTHIYNPLGVRPVIVLNIEYFNNSHSLINPLYSEVIRDSYFTLGEYRKYDKGNNFYYTLYEPLSSHNPRLSGKKDIPELYEKVRNDFAIFMCLNLLETLILGYVYVFDNLRAEEYISIQDGLYLTYTGIFNSNSYISTTIYLVKDGKWYFCGDSWNPNQGTIESNFFSKLEPIDTQDIKPFFYAIYVSCWEDLNPDLELYMPHKDRDKTIFWLGKRFHYVDDPEPKDERDNGIYEALDSLMCKKNYTQFI